MNISKMLPVLSAASFALAGGAAFAQRIEQDSQLLAYQGKWTPANDTNASAGSFTASSETSASVAFKVSGKNFILYRKMDPSGGVADVKVDGKPFGEISFYFQEARWQVPAVIDMDELGAGPHDIVLTPSATKPDGSAGNNVYIDALEHPVPANIPVSAVFGVVTVPSELQLAALARTNFWRAKMGLPLGRNHLALSLAAHAHAKHNSDADDAGKAFSPHNETFGASPNFTGVGPTDRAQYFGFPYSKSAGEDVTIHGDPVRFVDGWVLDGVYHREPFTSYSLTNIGYGGFPAGGSMEFGSNIDPIFPDKEVVITMPADGQTDVPLSYSGGDGPNQVSVTAGPFGFPITASVAGPISAASIGPVTPSTGTLTEAANPANLVPVTIADPATDPQLRSVVMIPNKPLAPATTYIATISGSDPNPFDPTQGRRFTKTWRFTTSGQHAIYNERFVERFVNRAAGTANINWDMYTAGVPSQLEYGPDANYGTVIPGKAFPGRATTFTADLTGMNDIPVMHWRVTSRDAQGNSFATPDHVIIPRPKLIPLPAPTTPTPTPAPTPGTGEERLSPGAVLSPNNQMLSPNKSHRLLYQPDGNLVLYRVADNFVVWASNTAGQTPSRLVMQADGNLVMYGIDNNAQWHSATFGNENSTALLLDEGKLVIINSIGQTIWSNGVVPPLPTALPVRSKLIPGAALLPGQSLNSVNGVYRLTYQGDGNLVVYKDNTTALWSSGTVGKEPGRVCMQSDGNLVIYGKDGAPQWASATNSAANTNSELIMQTDGNLVIYNRNGAAIWSIR